MNQSKPGGGEPDASDVINSPQRSPVRVDRLGDGTLCFATNRDGEYIVIESAGVTPAEV